MIQIRNIVNARYPFGRATSLFLPASPILTRPAQRSDTLLRTPSSETTLLRPSTADSCLLRPTASQ